MRIILLALWLLPLYSTAQPGEQLTVKDIYKTGPITWLGLDFANAVITDTSISQKDLSYKLIPDWNDIITREPDKFKFNKALHRSNTIFAEGVAHKANANIGRSFKEPSGLTRSRINERVKDYDLSGRAGIGLMVVVDSLSKEKKQAIVWVTFIDMGSKEVLQTIRATGKPSGFGVRNYWANAYAEIFELMADNWQKWRKEALQR